MSGKIILADNMAVLPELPGESTDLVYTDPPFNTGKVQKRTRMRTVRDGNGDRVGFKGQKYRTVAVGTRSFNDRFDDFLAFLEPRLRETYRVLKPAGSLFLHLDYREVHYCKVALDQVFGRECFMNEIVWAYDYGARCRTKWAAKHDNILWYARDPGNYHFDLDECDRIPYMAPSLVGEEKAARGKIPTDTWWHTIVSPTGKEKTGYPTQKPRGVIDRIVRVHSRPGDLLCDFFAGSGTLGESAYEYGRNCLLIDNNRKALETMEKRFRGKKVVWHNWPADDIPGESTSIREETG